MPRGSIMMPKSMSSDLIRGWNHAWVKPGGKLFARLHAQLIAIDDIHAFLLIQSKRIVI